MSRVATLSSILVAAALGLAVGLSASSPPESTADAPQEAPTSEWRAHLAATRHSVPAETARAAAWETLDSATHQLAILEAIQTLGLVGTREDLPLLESIAWSPDRELHAVAIEAAARIGGAEAHQLVLALTQHPELLRRQHALVALGRFGDPSDIPLLSQALQDPTTAHYAARALLRTDHATAVSHVAASFRNATPQTVRWHAMLMAQSGHPDALQALRDAVDGQQPQQGAAIVALASLGDADLLPLLEEQLRTGPHQVRSEIASALAHIEDPRAGKLLYQAATTGPAAVRHSALYSLAQRSDDTSRKALARILLEGNNEVATAAVWSITDIQEPAWYDALLLASRRRGGSVGRTAMARLFQGPWTARPPDDLLELATEHLRQGTFEGQELVAFLIQHGDPALQQEVTQVLLDGPLAQRTAGVWALQGVPGPHAEALLIALGQDPSPQVRQSAIQAMISRGGLEPQVEHLLSEGLASGDHWAVSMLSQLGTPTAMATLEDTLHNGSSARRREALWALAGSGSDDALRRLESAHSRTDDPAWQREIAIQLLESGRPSPSLLKDSLDSGDPQLMSSATRSIAQSGAPDASDRLATLAHHDDPQVRMSALMGLGQVGGDTAESELMSALQDPDVSQIAVNTLHGLGTPGAYEALSQAAANQELPEATRISAMATLPRRGDKQSAQILDQALWDGSANVRSAAISGMSQLGTQQARASLGDFFDAALDDPDLENQAAEAAYALQQLGGDAFEARREAIEALTQPQDLAYPSPDVAYFDFDDIIID